MINMKTAIMEKGNIVKILKWFKAHSDEEYADILEEVVKESRNKLSLG